MPTTRGGAGPGGPRRVAGVIGPRRCGSMSRVEPAELAVFLAEHPPFDALGPEALDAVARGARLERFCPGAVILDAFRNPTVEVFVVVSGRVLLWHHADPGTTEADEVRGPGGVFGFSAMLTERSSVRARSPTARSWRRGSPRRSLRPPSRRAPGRGSSPRR